MSKPPDTLEELGDSLDLLEKLKNDQDQIEGRFNPLYEQFSILKKYEVQIDEKVIIVLVIHYRVFKLLVNHEPQPHVGYALKPVGGPVVAPFSLRISAMYVQCIHVHCMCYVYVMYVQCIIHVQCMCNV